MMNINEVQKGEMKDIQREEQGISLQRSLGGSSHHKRSQGSQGKGLEHDSGCHKTGKTHPAKSCKPWEDKDDEDDQEGLGPWKYQA